jgi:hypothetical protein
VVQDYWVGCLECSMVSLVELVVSVVVMDFKDFLALLVEVSMVLVTKAVVWVKAKMVYREVLKGVLTAVLDSGMLKGVLESVY